MVALQLDKAGHSVAVIDQDASSFKRLGKEFDGDTITGIGFDRDRLIEAGIEKATAFIAVSSGDNSNILAARVARETFGVQNVVARIYDQKRAEVYERLGIPTVATVAWTGDQILRKVIPSDGVEVWRDPSGSVTLGEVQYHPSWIGLSVNKINDEISGTIAVVTRYGKALVPDADCVLQDGDTIHILANTKILSTVAAQLNAERSQ